MPSLFVNGDYDQACRRSAVNPWAGHVLEASMGISPELEEFCSRWLAKADDYPDCDTNLAHAFDRFFTLFVVYNRLYAEATYRLGQRGRITLTRRFPDAEASQEFVVQYLTASALLRAIDHQRGADVTTIRDLLQQGRFALKLDPPDFRPNRDLDLDLSRRLGSRGNQRACAVLETLYCIRCNIFHGQKGFHQEQLELLAPASRLLLVVIEALYQGLRDEPVA
jgi:hypothetical protein